MCEEIHSHTHHDLALVLPQTDLQTELALVPEATFSPLHAVPGLGQGLGLGEGNDGFSAVDAHSFSNENDNDDNNDNHKDNITTTITTTTTNNTVSVFSPGSELILPFFGTGGEGDVDSPPTYPTLLAGGLSPVRTHKDKGSSQHIGKGFDQDALSNRPTSPGTSPGPDAVAGFSPSPSRRSNAISSPSPSPSAGAVAGFSPSPSRRSNAISGPGPGPSPGAVSGPGPGPGAGAGAVTPGRSHTLSIKASLTHLR